MADRVVFTGLRSDVPALLSAADVAVMPSLNEALSNVLLESMAAGAPTVATRVGGTPEALVDEQTGLLVPPGDSQSLAAAISRLLDDRGACEPSWRGRTPVRSRSSLRGADGQRNQNSSIRSFLRASSASRFPVSGMIRALSASSTPVRRPVLAEVPSATRCTVDVVTDYDEFLELESAWNDAVRRAAVMHPFLRHEWMRTWWRRSRPARSCTCWSSAIDGRIAAIAPLMRESVVMYGFRARRIRMIHNDHTPRTDLIVASHPEESYRAIWNALQDECDRWDVLLLSQLERDSRTRAEIPQLAAANAVRLACGRAAIRRT